VTIRTDRVVLDTNVWIFGLRRTPTFPSCSDLLEQVAELNVAIPRQIFQELQPNLNEEEIRDLFQLIEMKSIEAEASLRSSLVAFQRLYLTGGDLSAWWGRRPRPPGRRGRRGRPSGPGPARR